MDLWLIGGEGWGQCVMKLIQCSGLQWIYGQLGGSAASRSAKFGVVVFKASLLKWGGQSVIDPCYTITPSPCQLTIDPCYTNTPFPCLSTIDPCYIITPISLPKYLCIMLNVKVMWCSSLLWIYGQLEEGVGPINHRSMLHHYTP